MIIENICINLGLTNSVFILWDHTSKFSTLAWNKICSQIQKETDINYKVGLKYNKAQFNNNPDELSLSELSQIWMLH